jgi:hypothetical protein
MGNVQTRGASDEVAKIQNDLTLLRSCSPEAERPIVWEEEQSVMSHSAINTMENIVLGVTLQRSKSGDLLSKFLSRKGKRANKSPGGMKRSVSFSQVLSDHIDNPSTSFSDDSSTEECEENDASCNGELAGELHAHYSTHILAAGIAEGFSQDREISLVTHEGLKEALNVEFKQIQTET